EIDTSGYPEYNAIVGGVAAHWDEATGDMICRAVVGWGGRGVRGDTDRIGNKLVAGILTNILANRNAIGLTAIERPVPAAGRGGLVCAHCGFASAHERAFYCPKCGMRLLRGCLATPARCPSTTPPGRNAGGDSKSSPACTPTVRPNARCAAAARSARPSPPQR